MTPYINTDMENTISTHKDRIIQLTLNQLSSQYIVMRCLKYLLEAIEALSPDKPITLIYIKNMC